MKYLLSLFFLMPVAQAFTLNNNFGASFKDSQVKVLVDEQTTCAQVGMTIYELQDLVDAAVKNFWNQIPTSSLSLSADGFSAATPNINTGRLCSATDDSCISGAGGSLIPPVEEIIIACNSLNTNFGGSDVLAVTVPNKFQGKKILGAIILINNDTNNNFRNLSRSDKISVLAHEIGHAIGLGHAGPKNNEALMFYKVVNLRTNLAQDDIDGVSYLYPAHVDACGLLGTLGGPRSDPPFWQLGITLGILILVFEMRKLFNRPKAGTPA